MSTTDYATWNSPALSVAYHLPLFHEIDYSVNESFRRIPHGGIESGGLLFGTRDAQGIRIEAFRPIDCEHAFGPSFQLSLGDVERIRQQLAAAVTDAELSGMVSLGWFIAHTRSDLVLTDGEAALFDQLFPGPGALTILVKPEKFKPTRFAFLPRQVNGSIERDGRPSPVILPLPVRGARAPKPPVDARAALQPEPPADPAAVRAEPVRVFIEGGPLLETVLDPAPALQFQPEPDVPEEPEPVRVFVQRDSSPLADVVEPATAVQAELMQEPASLVESEPSRVFVEREPPEEAHTVEALPQLPLGPAQGTKPPVVREMRAPAFADDERPLWRAVHARPFPDPQPTIAPEPVEFPRRAPASPPPSADTTQPDVAREPSVFERARQRQESQATGPSPTANAWGILHWVMLALTLVCAGVVAYGVYLRSQPSSIPLTAVRHNNILVIEWPSSFTRDAPNATVRVNDGPIVTLAAADRTSGTTVVPNRAASVKVELSVHRWLHEARGIVHFVALTPSSATATPAP